MEQRLSELVEALTTSGEPRLDPGKVKELKQICKYVRGSAPGEAGKQPRTAAWCGGERGGTAVEPGLRGGDGARICCRGGRNRPGGRAGVPGGRVAWVSTPPSLRLRPRAEAELGVTLPRGTAGRVPRAADSGENFGFHPKEGSAWPGLPGNPLAARRAGLGRWSAQPLGGAAGGPVPLPRTHPVRFNL